MVDSKDAGLPGYRSSEFVSGLMQSDGSTKQEHELLLSVVRSSVDGVLAYDRECRYTIWNPAMERISGVAATKTIGKCAFDVFPFLKEIGEDRYFYETLEGREVVTRDRSYTVPSTGHSGFFDGHYMPLRNAQGKVIGGLGIIRDITDLKATQAQLLQSGKLSAVDQLGAGIAHELNQPLACLQLLLNMIRKTPQQTIADCAEDLQIMSDQLVRMAKIVDNIRVFSRKSHFEARPTRATEPLNAALALVSEQLRMAGISVQEDIEDDLPLIDGDPSRLQQVFLNLFNNALQALDGASGDKRIEVGARVRPQVVEFWVEDSGPGFGSEQLERALDPFYTTKDPGQGTGLGLSLCHRILREHAGEIQLENAGGGGGRVVFRVPRSARTVDDERTERALQQ